LRGRAGPLVRYIAGQWRIACDVDFGLQTLLIEQDNFTHIDLGVVFCIHEDDPPLISAAQCKAH
jgi:hypothetical protein